MVRLRAMKILQEFREFALRGNVMDLAVGVIIGGAFGKIVTSLVQDVITPVLSILTGGIQFTDRAVTLRTAMEGSAAIVLHYGAFIQNVIDFLIIAFVIFLMVKVMNRLRRRYKKSDPGEQTASHPSAEERLLTEIRDILRDSARRN